MRQDLTKIFKNDHFGNVRVVLINGKEYFVGKDIAEALGYINPSKALNDHCRRVKKGWTNDSLGRRQQANLIPEGDVYRLIARSELPLAIEFEEWVFEKVLPSIRKHGAYITQEVAEKLKENPNYITDLISELEETSKHNEQLLHDYNDIRLMKMNTTNEVAEYVEEQLVYSGKGKLRCANLYSNYRTWCGRQHHYTPYSVQQFEELIYYCLVEGHPIIKEGNYYIGIEVKK